MRLTIAEIESSIQRGLGCTHEEAERLEQHRRDAADHADWLLRRELEAD